MNRAHLTRVVATALGLTLATGLLAGCGKQGTLDQPAPLFGDKARVDYEAARTAAATPSVDNQGRGQSSTPDNTPPSTRDVRDPAQRLSPASTAPVPGAPNMAGAPIQTTPNF